MFATPTYTGEQIARSYTRDRIRDTEARRAARTARAATREARYVEPAAAVAPPVRRWRLLSTRGGTPRRLRAI